MNNSMATVKGRLIEIIQAQPDDASFDEIVRELVLERIVTRGLEDIRTGRVISNEEMVRRIRTWQK